MAEKQLIIAIEGSAAMGPFWQTIVSDYLEKIIRSFCCVDLGGQKPSAPNFELSLVMFNAHGSYSAFLVQRSGWTKDVDTFLQWLSAIPFAGGGFGDAAIAEGLAEALMMFSNASKANQIPPNADGSKHCILVAASNPYPLPTTMYQPLKIVEKGEDNEAQPLAESRLSDAEAVAISYAQCAVSLSIICPKQLPKLRAIYNVARRNPHGADPPVDNVKNPQHLILLSENFMEARAALSRPGITSFPSYQSPVKMDVPTAPPGTPPTSNPTVNGPIMNQQPISVANMPLSQQASTSTLQSAQSKFVKVWEGNLSGQRQGQPVFITRLEGYRSASASETLAVNWPVTMQIVRLISQDYMSNKKYVGKADFLAFRAMTQHGFLGQLQEKKLCAVIQLPSQTLLLYVSDKACSMIGMLFFPGGTELFKPQPQMQQNPQMQQQMQQFPQMQLQQLQQQVPQMQQQQQEVPQMQQQQQHPQMQQQQVQQMQQQMVGNGMGPAYVQGPGRAQLVSQGQVPSQAPQQNLPGSGYLT